MTTAGADPARQISLTSAARVSASQSPDLLERARLLWPRLEPPHDPSVRHDPGRMAAHISRRTALPADTIRAILEAA